MPYAPPTPPPAPPSFQKEVAPILRTACMGCHVAPTPAGGISLASFAELMKGGKSGPALVPGKSGSSRMVQMMTGAIKPQMPPTGMLKPADVDVIRRWVDAGAKEDVLSAVPAADKVRAAVKTASVAALPEYRPLGRMRNIAAPVQSLAFSPDGKTLAAGTYQKVLFFDPTTRLASAIWEGHADSVRTLTFSPDGKWLAAGEGMPGASGAVRLWNVADRRLERAFGNQSDAINALCFSPDGKTLATASADKSIQIWETATGKPLQTLRDHADAVLGVAFRADGKYLASCGADKSVKIWDATTWKRLYTIGAHEETVTAVAFAPGENPLISVGNDRVAKIWNVVADHADAVRTLGGHEGSVLAVALTLDGQIAATASADKTVRLWKVGDGANLATLADAKDWVYSVRFSPDGKRLAAGTWDGQIYLWNVETRKLEGVLSTLRPNP